MLKFQPGNWRSSEAATSANGEKLVQEEVMLAGGNIKALYYFFRDDKHRSFNC